MHEETNSFKFMIGEFALQCERKQNSCKMMNMDMIYAFLKPFQKSALKQFLNISCLSKIQSISVFTSQTVSNCIFIHLEEAWKL